MRKEGFGGFSVKYFMEDKDKKENRGYIVWSIVIGALLSFLINIFSNLYYSLFVVGDLSFDKINGNYFVFCVLLFIALNGYLGFFIHDYPNSFEFSKGYWLRYKNYFFNKYLPGRIIGKIIRWILGFYLILFLVILLGYLFILSINLWGQTYGIITFILFLFLIFIRVKYGKNNHGNRVSHH